MAMDERGDARVLIARCRSDTMTKSRRSGPRDATLRVWGGETGRENWGRATQVPVVHSVSFGMTTSMFGTAWRLGARRALSTVATQIRRCVPSRRSAAALKARIRSTNPPDAWALDAGARYLEFEVSEHGAGAVAQCGMQPGFA